jgi:hypothetical protein
MTPGTDALNFFSSSLLLLTKYVCEFDLSAKPNKYLELIIKWRNNGLNPKC